MDLDGGSKSGPTNLKDEFKSSENHGDYGKKHDTQTFVFLLILPLFVTFRTRSTNLG